MDISLGVIVVGVIYLAGALFALLNTSNTAPLARHIKVSAIYLAWIYLAVFFISTTTRFYLGIRYKKRKQELHK